MHEVGIIWHIQHAYNVCLLHCLGMHALKFGGQIFQSLNLDFLTPYTLKSMILKLKSHSE
jgi:hypothetical protein